MKPEYNTNYSESCDCPYCGETQDVDIDGDDVWNEEIECDDCGGLFRYSLEITHEFTCEPIDGEGPRNEDGELVAGPKFIDPNQINLFETKA